MGFPVAICGPKTLQNSWMLRMEIGSKTAGYQDSSGYHYFYETSISLLAASPHHASSPRAQQESLVLRLQRPRLPLKVPTLCLVVEREPAS